MILCNLKTEMHESIKVNVKGYQSYLMGAIIVKPTP